MIVRAIVLSPQNNLRRNFHPQLPIERVRQDCATLSEIFMFQKKRKSLRNLVSERPIELNKNFGLRASRHTKIRQLRGFVFGLIFGLTSFLNMEYAEAQMPVTKRAVGNTDALAVGPTPLEAVPRPTRGVVYKTYTRAGETEQRKLQMFVFEPPGFRPSDLRPCFFVIHGGGWTGGKPERAFHIASHFAERGMVGISIQYRLMDSKIGQTVADCVRDGRSAVRYIKRHAAEFGIDPHQIVVSGLSAGGHIAAGTALFEGFDEIGDDASVSSRPVALVLFCPVLDTSREGFGSAKLGEQWQELSAIERMRSGVPPTIIFHVKGDPVVSYKGSVHFAEAMAKAGNICEVVGYEGSRHCGITSDPASLGEVLGKVANFLRPLGIKTTGY